MIAAVHALTGAALSRLCRTHGEAFLLGGLSHVIADMLPHRDLDIPEEAALLAGALALITGARGPASREFAGAVGAALPDVENLIARLRGLPDDRLLFPTHASYHGPKTRDFRLQIALALTGLLLLAIPATSRCDHQPQRGNSSR